MAKPQSRGQLINFGLRKLGYPVLEINLDTDQIHDALDDTLQLYQERHYNGIERMYLKYKITQEDLDRGRAQGTDGVGIVTTTGISTNTAGTVSSNFYETSNFIAVPEHVLGVNKIFKFDSSSISGGMFSIKYQLFLNDLYYFNSVELLQFAMTKTYLEDIDFLLTTEKQIRFNQRQDRLYMDMDFSAMSVDDFLRSPAEPFGMDEFALKMGLPTAAADLETADVQMKDCSAAEIFEEEAPIADHLEPKAENS